MNGNFYLTPYFPAFFTLIIATIMVFFFPPSVYSYFIREPDFIYGDIKTWGFVVSCLTLFCMGVKIASFKTIYNFSIYFKKVNVFTHLAILLFIGYFLVFFYLVVFNYFVKLKFGLTFWKILMLYGYQFLKYRESFIPFGIGAIPTFLGFYSFYIFYLAKISTKLEYRKLYIYLSHMFVLSAFLLNLLTVNRNIIVITFFGLILIHAYFNRDFKFKKFLILIFVLTFIFISTLFIRFGNLNNFQFIGENLIGYTVASYNRLSLIISHGANLKDIDPSIFDLILPNRIPLLHIYIKKTLTMTEYLQHWHSLLKGYNLNYWFNLKTFFGDVYNRLGLFSPFFFLLYGFMAGRFSQYFREGRLLGIIFYPTLFASIFVWSLTNIFVTNFFQNIYVFLFLFLLNTLINPNLLKLTRSCRNAHITTNASSSLSSN